MKSGWHLLKSRSPCEFRDEEGRRIRRPIENPRARGRLSLRVSDVLGLQTLGAALYLELYFASLLQRLVAVHLDRREGDKYVFAIGPLDEPIALGGVEPFHSTFFSHVRVSPDSGPTPVHAEETMRSNAG